MRFDDTNTHAHHNSIQVVRREGGERETERRYFITQAQVGFFTNLSLMTNTATHTHTQRGDSEKKKRRKEIKPKTKLKNERMGGGGGG